VNRRIDLDRIVERFIPRSMTAFRARAWARFVVAVSLWSAPVWLVFPIIGGLGGGLPWWCTITLAALGALQVAVPFVLRATGSLYAAIMLFGTLAFVGIALSASVLGGFPFHSLMWAMGIPVALAAQRQFRSLLPIWTLAVVALYLGWYALVATGHAPGAERWVEPSFEPWLQAASLMCWVAVMLLVSHKTSAVTYELAESRDAYQRALLQAQKLNALGKLAGSIENNFNNALMSIDYSLHLLAEQLGGTELGVELDDMQQMVVRSKALSKKLERLGQGDNETIELVEVDPAVDALARTLRRLTGAAQLRVDLHAPGATILCDVNQLDQVLVNLVVNARDAMPGGGEIVLATRLEAGSVVIEVRDTGVGIEPEVLNHIFEPFYTTKGPDTGTGLGLWICRSIAGGCGGTLTATSTVGRGTTMTLRLPLAGRDARPQPRASVAVRPTEAIHRVQPRTRPRWWSSAIDWFVSDIADGRLRLWGVVLVLVSFASVPIWLLFAFAQWQTFGPNTIAGVLVVGGVLSLSVPCVVRLTRTPELAAFVFAAIPFVGITIVAIVSGGFRIEILIWTTLIPILGAQQRELRYFTRWWAVAVMVQIATVFALAVTGVTRPALPPEMVADEQLAVLLGLLALLSFGFRAASRVGEHFARERDDYAATLVRSQDFELLGLMASSIAHDLNNILTTLEYGIDYIRSELPAEHPALDQLDDLQAATARVHDLSRQLTRFGRANTDSANAVPDVALATLAKMLGPIVGSHIKICMQLDSGASAIRVRNHELDQLIINLALNARDAMPEGGELHIATRATEGAVELTVRDDGIGIPPALLAHVCTPFFTTAEDRVGLGLWVCREIVREAHGSLEVESVVGRGTTVRMVIPRVLARHSDSIRRPAARHSASLLREAPASLPSDPELPQPSSSPGIHGES